MSLAKADQCDERKEQEIPIGTGIRAIERVTMDGTRLKNPAVSVSGMCDKILIGHLGDRHMHGSRVLDLGCGTGVNGLYFARNGCAVEMVDISEDAIRICEANAQQLGVSVETKTADVRGVSLEPNTYDLIILSYLVQFMRAEDGRELLTKCIAALKPGGDLYLSVFSVAEDLFKKAEEDSNQIATGVLRLDERTFQFSNGRILHFQTATELLTNCKALRCKHFFEGRELDESHGEPHYHSFLAYIGTKED